MRRQQSISPPADIIGHRSSAVLNQRIPQSRHPQRNPLIQDRMKQPAPKRQYANSIGRRPLRKEQHRKPAPVSLRHRHIHPRIRTRSTTPRHIHRPRPRRQPTDQRPTTDLPLGNHHKRSHSGIQQDIQVAQVIRNHSPTHRKLTLNTPLHPNRPHKAPAQSMHPHRPLHPHPRRPHPKIHRIAGSLHIFAPIVR